MLCLSTLTVTNMFPDAGMNERADEVRFECKSRGWGHRLRHLMSHLMKLRHVPGRFSNLPERVHSGCFHVNEWSSTVVPHLSKGRTASTDYSERPSLQRALLSGRHVYNHTERREQFRHLRKFCASVPLNASAEANRSRRSSALRLSRREACLYLDRICSVCAENKCKNSL